MAGAREKILEIMRKLAFGRMIERGLEDVRNGRVIDNDEMKRCIRSWQC